jgi:ABC-type branched-subunit amino acid transport system ATPase component
VIIDEPTEGLAPKLVAQTTEAHTQCHWAGNVTTDKRLLAHTLAGELTRRRPRIEDVGSS